MSIPTVDLSTVNIDIPDDKLNQDDLKSVAKLVKDAFMNWGFVYFTGHGIDSEHITNVFNYSMEFFRLPLDAKKRNLRGVIGPESNFGYTSMGAETFDRDAPYDVKEAFDYAVETKDESIQPWPKEIPHFKTEIRKFFHMGSLLTKRILHIIGVAVELDDPLYFVKAHALLEDIGNSSAVRTLFYPPIDNSKDIQPGQLRCSEHTDYGSITLLFQDNAGGLLVKSRSGEYVPATPVKDAVIVNIADLMQRWTNDELISVKHKVIIPEEELRRQKGRQSLVFFAQPDDAHIVKCINESNKYPPVSSKDYLMSRFNDTYI